MKTRNSSAILGLSTLMMTLNRFDQRLFRRSRGLFVMVPVGFIAITF